MILVPNLGGASCQLRPAPVLTVVVSQGAVVHHRRDVGEHTLQGERQCLQAAGAFQLQTQEPTSPVCSETSVRPNNSKATAQQQSEYRELRY